MVLWIRVRLFGGLSSDPVILFAMFWDHVGWGCGHAAKKYRSAISGIVSLACEDIRRQITERGLPQRLRVDNGPEFLGPDFVTWTEAAGMVIQYIQKGEPNQNAYIERFHRTYREEVLNLYLFCNLAEVWGTTHWWRLDYNERRPHDALVGRTPAECSNQNAKLSTIELSP